MSRSSNSDGWRRSGLGCIATSCLVTDFSCHGSASRLAELGRGDQEPVPPVRPPGAAAQVGPANQAGCDARQRRQVALGELGAQHVNIQPSVRGRHGVPLAGENPVQAVTEQGVPRVAKPRRVVTVGLGVDLKRPPRRRLVRPADAGKHTGGGERLDDFLLFTHEPKIPRRQKILRENEPCRRVEVRERTRQGSARSWHEPNGGGIRLPE